MIHLFSSFGRIRFIEKGSLVFPGKYSSFLSYHLVQSFFFPGHSWLNPTSRSGSGPRYLLFPLFISDEKRDYLSPPFGISSFSEDFSSLHLQADITFFPSFSLRGFWTLLPLRRGPSIFLFFSTLASFFEAKSLSFPP